MRNWRSLIKLMSFPLLAPYLLDLYFIGGNSPVNKELPSLRQGSSGPFLMASTNTFVPTIKIAV